MHLLYSTLSQSIYTSDPGSIYETQYVMDSLRTTHYQEPGQDLTDVGHLYGESNDREDIKAGAETDADAEYCCADLVAEILSLLLVPYRLEHFDEPVDEPAQHTYLSNHIT